MTFKLLLPDSIELALPETEGVEFVTLSIGEEIPAQHLDANGLVVWGQSVPWLKTAAKTLKELQWVQILAAGPNSILEAGFAPEVKLSSGQSLHDYPVSEHALALILAAARKLPAIFEAQKQHRWATELGGIQTESSIEFSTLFQKRVAIWGFGSIARTLTPMLQLLGAEVVGIANSRRVEAGVQVYPVTEVAEVLPKLDLLIMLLPQTAQTDKILSKELLALLPKHAWLVNVGRGSTVDEEALLTALNQDELAGAALDVTRVEPLPSDSPLWSAKNIIITPHAAGGRPRAARELILENLEKLQKQSPLINEINRN